MSGEVELVADRWWRRLRCRTELEVNATGELKTAVDTNGCRTAASVEVKSFVGSKSCVEVLKATGSEAHKRVQGCSRH